MSPSLDRICYYLKQYKAAGYAGVNGERRIARIHNLPQNYLDDDSARTKAIAMRCCTSEAVLTFWLNFPRHHSRNHK